MDGMFDGLDLDELTTTISKGTYRLRLDDVSDKEASTEYGEPERRYLIFNFSIADEREEVEDWDGERVKGVFLNYWPNLKDDLKTNKEKIDMSQVRRSAKLYQVLGRAFGIDEEEIKAAKVEWENYTGSYVYATLFPNNKDGEPQADQNSFVSESSVEI